MITETYKGTSYLLLSSLFFIASGYLINIFLGRRLGPELYGVYGVVIAFWSGVNLILTAGLPQAVSKFVSEDEKNAESILKSAINLQAIGVLIIGVIYYLLAETVASAFKDPTLIPYLKLSSFIFPFYSFYSIYTSYYNGLHAFKKQSFMTIIYSLAKLVSIIGLSINFKLYGAIFGFIIAPTVALLTGFHFPKTVTHQIFPYKKLLLFSLPLIGFTVFATLQQSIDLFLVKALIHSGESAGFYTAVQNISKIPLFALSAFSLVLFPTISRSVAQNQHEKATALIQHSLRLVLLVLTPGILLISATSKELVTLLFSKTYLPAAYPLSILIIGFGFLTLSHILSNILSGSGSPKTPLYISLIGAFLSGFFCYLLIPEFGLVGAALASTLASGIGFLLLALLVYKKFKVFTSFTSFGKVLLASSIVFFITKAINPSPLKLILLYPLMFTIYTIILILVKEISRQDLNYLKDAVFKRKL
ncbi:hypothetical protein A2716_04325 [candidate division WWE3 bacterium RIFCSPHIGHO2_01_FULL_40_23]|uniref:Uncharacterized protein n=1 Tax=candidate division WWE3 bacterium RIFCSPLOWO2_01_FULL_41_18 TaxID=1802625 RepID=A0A1F4VDS7_UNCKA|nr:MAG: hypothetical protein A2716_04325 [candidate division WWE3 bacterium RIFCSPHIGHO2_01_FULL_40_23]OGC55100.1 MAG: hypothetical protein A3A78_03935 [candidate division WWE3 bacterium RIFCSPLOWO2_01_FULL_41_18]